MEKERISMEIHSNDYSKGQKMLHSYLQVRSYLEVNWTYIYQKESHLVIIQYGNLRHFQVCTKIERSHKGISLLTKKQTKNTPHQNKQEQPHKKNPTQTPERLTVLSLSMPEITV